MDISYIAGFFDGEGSVRHLKYSVRLVFYNTHLGVLKAVAGFLNCGTIYPSRSKNPNKPQYQLEMAHHLDVLRVAKLLLPHSIVKHGPLKDLISFIENRRWQRKGGHRIRNTPLDPDETRRGTK